MATNTFVTPTWVTKEVARFWYNSVKFAANVNRSYDDQYEQAGAKVGYTVQARLPQRFVVTSGQSLQQQAILNQTTPISLTDQLNVAFGWSSADATMVVEEVRSRYVMPAAEALANKTDANGLQQMYPFVNQFVGSPGVVPNSNLTYLQAVARLRNMGAWGPYCAVLDPNAETTLVNANQTLFNPALKISEQYRQGEFGRSALGIDEWYSDPNVFAHTTGTFTASTPLINGANQTGSSLITDGWASSAATLNAGDTFTIGGVYAVNPISYVNTGQLQEFVVTATTSSVGVDIAALPIFPPIITSGQLQTVSNSPADNAVITVTGATSATAGTLATTVTKQSLIFNKDAFALVMADLIKPRAGALATSVRSKELAISIRMVEQYNIQTDQEPARLDILIGWAPIMPEWYACRVYSS